jgi:cytochrome c oxidase subunit III
MAVSAFSALDEDVTPSSSGGAVSQADLTMHGHSAGMAEPTFSVPAKKMAMWLFIIADTATFAGCLVAYGFLRNGSANWPTPFKFSPTVINAMVMTFILVSSSLTMLVAVRSAKQGDKAAAFRWTMITSVGGILFAALHIREWIGMINEGATLLHNPWGTPLFGASFFTITGLHLLHVLGGVVALIAVGLRYKRGRYNADDLEITGLYWHFVDLVWMFVVPFLYLLNAAR